MLGERIHDPLGIEGPPGSSAGLGLLALETTLAPKKQLRTVTGRLAFADVAVAGYEIHAGVTQGPALARPALALAHGPDGARSDDDQILGTYLHGLFDEAPACAALLAWAGRPGLAPTDTAAAREATFERLADLVAEHLDTTALLALLGLPPD